MSDVYKSRWAACDTCETTVIVERDTPEGVPPDEEWENWISCPVCDASLIWGNADPDTQANTYWRMGFKAAQQQEVS